VEIDKCPAHNRWALRITLCGTGIRPASSHFLSGAVMKKILALVVAAAFGLPLVVIAQDKADPEAQFKKMDKDSDGKLSLEEFKGKRQGDKATKAEERFKKLDKNSDNSLSLEEFKAGQRKKK
jgi:hypothetical protein